MILPTSPPRRTEVRRPALVSALLLVLAVPAPPPARAQEIRGVVTDELAHRSVPAAAVTLLDRKGKARAQTLTDAAGHFALPVPEGGEYYLRADALGYDDTLSPLLAVSGGRDYDIELMVRPAPLGLEPLVVTADRYREWVRRWTGLNPAGLMGKVMAGDEWRKLALPGRDMAQALRFANLPGATVQRGVNGPCVSVGRITCVPFLVDGVPWTRLEVDGLRPDEVEAVVYLQSTDGSTLFTHAGHFNQRDPNSGGRVLIFRKGFLEGREGGR